MINRFKQLKLNEKIILIVLSLTYSYVLISGLLDNNLRYDTIESIVSFLILFLWLFLYNNFNIIRKWFDNNKLRILLTIIVAIVFLYFNNSLFISNTFTTKIINLLQGFLISSFFIELCYKNLIDSNDAIILILSIFVIPSFLKNSVYLIFAFILTIFSSYILFGTLIKVFEEVKKDKCLLVDIIGILISLVSLIVSLIK